MQRVAGGGSDRLEVDQGGYLIAGSLGGPGEGINLVAMAKELNARESNNWWAVGAAWRAALEADPIADIRVTVDFAQHSGTGRPQLFAVEHRIDADRPIREVFEQ